MFSDLASMVGQLSRTFSGTFASALRTVSPLISTIAKGATGVAQAFDSLPGPVKSIITLWATFGRAGKTAFESVEDRHVAEHPVHDAIPEDAQRTGFRAPNRRP